MPREPLIYKAALAAAVLDDIRLNAQARVAARGNCQGCVHVGRSLEQSGGVVAIALSFLDRIRSGVPRRQCRAPLFDELGALLAPSQGPAGTSGVGSVMRPRRARRSRDAD